jgi:hypothetical protein
MMDAATPNVVLVGCGRLGIHHLRGLLRVGRPLGIQVVEPDGDATGRARALVAEQAAGTGVQFLRSIEEASSQSDLTIVATQAAGRVALVQALLERGHRRFLLEKMVCQSDAEYASLLDGLERHGARAWINTVMRYNPLFRDVRARLTGGVFALEIVGSDMGLGSNAIHFVDLFQMLQGEFRLALRRESLLPQLFASKRGSHLVEFSGTLTGTDPSGSVLAVSNLPFATAVLTIAITSESVRVFVDVPAGKAQVSTSHAGWQSSTIDYRESYVSEVTPVAVRDILNTGSCELPEAVVLRPAHRELFRVFGDHIEAVTGRREDVCRVT